MFIKDKIANFERQKKYNIVKAQTRHIWLDDTMVDNDIGPKESLPSSLRVDLQPNELDP